MSLTHHEKISVGANVIVSCDDVIEGKCYIRILNDWRSWFHALDYCYQAGGYLIAPETPAAHAYIWQVITGTQFIISNFKAFLQLVQSE